MLLSTLVGGRFRDQHVECLQRWRRGIEGRVNPNVELLAHEPGSVIGLGRIALVHVNPTPLDDFPASRFGFCLGQPLCPHPHGLEEVHL